ncbi:hypothetical protein LOTGIDRAFT_239166 [Lottia gigantea]|uniref:Uncharacterized protein n=1 Tax=Lottia gigantea TaxID=225164 RepID=V4AQU4_LOTGI|nr:hypothetical protein LOTGIDRAFT_239166 [Lottia gigantea]ESO97200.1 hypothetical protein LOTGIDRAFT_239166 [Lottia gigantea]
MDAYKYELPKPHYSTPSNNYFCGDWKSTVWTAPAHYVPSERRWIDHPDYRSLPREARRDAIDFQSEHEWVYYSRNRDTPGGYFHKDVGLHPSGRPELRLFGYTRNLPSMPGDTASQRAWYQNNNPTPAVRNSRGDYYGFYHQALDSENERRMINTPMNFKVQPNDIPKL